MPAFRILPDVEAVAAATADRIVAAGRNAIRRRGRFMLALSGGSTPLAVCPLLVVPPRVRQLDWSRVEFFFGDERAVGPADEESNFRAAREALLDHLPKVSMTQVHRMRGEATNLDEAAWQYEEQMRSAFGIEGARPLPRLDLVWLGMGSDGHTASLFPGSAALVERRRWVIANWAPGPGAWRLTLTYPVINAARDVMFVVTGAEKASAFARVRSGDHAMPAARVRDRRTLWLVDAAAGGSAPR